MFTTHNLKKCQAQQKNDFIGTILNTNLIKNKLDMYQNVVDKEMFDFEIIEKLNITEKCL